MNSFQIGFMGLGWQPRSFLPSHLDLEWVFLVARTYVQGNSKPECLPVLIRAPTSKTGNILNCRGVVWDERFISGFRFASWVVLISS